MSFCNKCGHPLPDDMMFCTQCGTKRTDVVKQAEPAKEPKKRKAKKGWIWILLILLIALVAGGIFLWKSGKLDSVFKKNT